MMLDHDCLEESLQGMFGEILDEHALLEILIFVFFSLERIC